MIHSSWSPDPLHGFEQIALPTEAVLVRRRNVATAKRAVLYIHGFTDYFFQVHLAEFFEAQGYRFFAVDLRRHGRAWRSGERHCYIDTIDELIEDVEVAVQSLLKQNGIESVLLNGHSTGGLVAALYAHRGTSRKSISGVILNSPFLDLNVPPFLAAFVEPVVAGVGRWLPHFGLPSKSMGYGESLHRDFHGEWAYDLRLKPIQGSPIYLGWFRAIHRAHAEVARGLAIQCPCLVMHSSRSRVVTRWSPEVMSADIILNVEHMKKLGPKLGPKVTMAEIKDGLHDLILSPKPVRDAAFAAMASWMDANFG